MNSSKTRFKIPFHDEFMQNLYYLAVKHLSLAESTHTSATATLSTVAVVMQLKSSAQARRRAGVFEGYNYSFY